MKHNIFTVVTSVERESVDQLRQYLVNLNYLGAAPKDDPLGLTRLPMLHFASLFLFDDPKDGWFLVLESNIDGEIDPYLDALAKEGAACLAKIYSYCGGAPSTSPSALPNYWRQHIYHPEAGYVGNPFRTCQQIKLEAHVHRVADQALGFTGKLKEPGDAASDVIKALEDAPHTATYATGEMGRSGSTAARLMGAAAALVPVVFWVAVFLPLLLINYLKERAAKGDDLRPDAYHVRNQKQFEDYQPTNHMVSIVHLHPDWTRRTAKRAAFRILNFLARHHFTKGQLGSIPTIHFAHWAFLHEGRRLLFVSNYDGSWDSYLDDFTLKAAKGLTLAWAHSKGIPDTHFMLWGGAAKGPAFIDWARRSMVPTLVWYNAYSWMSVGNIDRNTDLREAIVKDKNAQNKGSWLERI
ncbi:MAG: hypothetical protein OEY85_13180 [Rhodospirillales bacterium]|nr:hypothetical protein [Rhodospirillales bacterium]